MIVLTLGSCWYVKFFAWLGPYAQPYINNLTALRVFWSTNQPYRVTTSVDVPLRNFWTPSSPRAQLSTTSLSQCYRDMRPRRQYRLSHPAPSPQPLVPPREYLQHSKLGDLPQYRMILHRSVFMADWGTKIAYSRIFMVIMERTWQVQRNMAIGTRRKKFWIKAMTGWVKMPDGITL